MRVHSVPGTVLRASCINSLTETQWKHSYYYPRCILGGMTYDNTLVVNTPHLQHTPSCNPVSLSSQHWPLSTMNILTHLCAECLIHTCIPNILSSFWWSTVGSLTTCWRDEGTKDRDLLESECLPALHEGWWWQGGSEGGCSRCSTTADMKGALIS